MATLKIHKRDTHIKYAPLCTVARMDDSQLTDDDEKVTCGRCLRMIERRKRVEVRR